MKRVRHNGKKMLVTLLAIGCMALVFLWPQWRDEARAQAQTAPGFQCFSDADCAAGVRCNDAHQCGPPGSTRCLNDEDCGDPGRLRCQDNFMCGPIATTCKCNCLCPGNETPTVSLIDCGLPCPPLGCEPPGALASFPAVCTPSVGP
jgi:hypothetical protein